MPSGLWSVCFRDTGRAILLLTGAIAAYPAIAAESAVELLQKMTETVRNLNYEGDFVYQTGEVLNGMHIVHTVQNGVEREHLVTLTGPAREIIRDDFTLTRYTPADKQVSVSERPRSHTPTLATFNPERLAPLYRIEQLGSERVAGRPTSLVALMPKDTYRYGHRLYLDEETALPLRRVVVDRNGRHVSQLMFTNIEISGMAKSRPRVEADEPAAVDYTGDWQFQNLPAGFLLERYDQRPSGQDVREHFLFSDGITRLSLYIEKAAGQHADNHVNVGAVGILATRVDNHKITVVGEAPIETLKHFLRSVSKKQQVPQGD